MFARVYRLYTPGQFGFQAQNLPVTFAKDGYFNMLSGGVVYECKYQMPSGFAWIQADVPRVQTHDSLDPLGSGQIHGMQPSAKQERNFHQTQVHVDHHLELPRASFAGLVRAVVHIPVLRYACPLVQARLDSRNAGKSLNELLFPAKFASRIEQIRGTRGPTSRTTRRHIRKKQRVERCVWQKHYGDMGIMNAAGRGRRIDSRNTNATAITRVADHKMARGKIETVA
ncbi:hypothetical protein BKA62DRAFT_678581 [Auriculariales sp. MPI-PUGE-AT-0066]|nr:hypothetical protein BKA62DRAFT_678581 [Auriculariales sp. MPI-PUGE-AT-0066]